MAKNSANKDSAKYIYSRGRSKEFIAFMNCKSRCTNPKRHDYHRYGGRGIQCSFKNASDLIAAIGRAPSKQHSLERISNNGHYEAGNVCWATPKQQANNRRNNRLIIINGVTKTLIQWSEYYGIDNQLSCARINRLKWCEQCAVTIPVWGGTCIHRNNT
jgi:hypothetical protein